ncbi:lipopolysaccharide biosynthesis protein [uncultured Clostridium sp.]|uniref:lipopolysaccharide biosynthesis protein n=1 Tax=uncultured Clostridium sp. TaxID=59620 RepID=UPI0026344280|nr:hypothetical protein [uncultured Clostridium sp.]
MALQIILIVRFKSYLLWVLCEIIFNNIALVYISLKCDRLFPNINFNKKFEILDVKKNNIQIQKTIKDVFFHKITTFIVYQTDGLLISIFLRLKDTGIYSNYMLIVNNCANVFNIMMGSFTASIGSLVSENNLEKTQKVFRRLYVMESYIAIVVSFILYKIINPFVEVWIGEGFLYVDGILVVLMMNLYIQISRGMVEKFKSAYGLFWDRMAPIIEGVINLVISMFLVNTVGVIGLFIGTLISNLIIVVIWKPYMLYKYGFNSSYKNYIILYLKYIALSVVSIVISELIISNVVYYDVAIRWEIFIINAIKVSLIVTVVTFIVYLIDDKFRELIKYVYNKIKSSVMNIVKKINKKSKC